MTANVRTRRRLVLGLLAAALAVVAVLSASIGAVRIPLPGLVAVIGERLGLDLPWAYAPRDEMVLLVVRLPRLLLGALVGAALAVTGASLQGLFRNPLADPGLIGVSSGAALAAVSVIVSGGAVLAALPEISRPLLLTVAAFAGGLGTVVIVYRIATVDGRTSVATMLLAGIAVNAIANAGTGFFIFISEDQQLRDFTFWTLGSLAGATWDRLLWGAPLLLVGILATPLLARSLNALLLGYAEAEHLGVRVGRVKRAVVGLTGLTVGVAVALTGIIGFVGLVTPHLVRLVVGPDHRLLLPASALLGAILLLSADLVARTVVAPAELPVGVVTAMLGAPFFVWLLVRQRSRGAAGVIA